MAAIVAQTNPGSTVVTDSVTSDQLQEFLENKLGLVHHRFKRGYRNVINESVRLNNEGTESCLAISKTDTLSLHICNKAVCVKLGNVLCML